MLFEIDSRQSVSIMMGDQKKSAELVKVLDAAAQYSDTCLFTFFPKEIHLSFSDFEAFSCTKVCFRVEYLGNPIQRREKSLMMSKVRNPVWYELKEETYSVKILLDVFASNLKKILKEKQYLVIYGTQDCELFLGGIDQVQPKNGQWFLNNYSKVPSTEPRARLYYNISPDFVKPDEKFVKFKLLNVEFERIITQMSICCGTHGGLGRLEFAPDMERGVNILSFYANDPSGGSSRLSVKGKLGLWKCSLDISEIKTNLFWTILKKIQPLLNTFESLSGIDFILTPRGLFFKIACRNELMSFLFFSTHQSTEHLQSYV